MIRMDYKVCTQQFVMPMLQCTQNCNELPIGCVIILLSHREAVGQVLHWQPSLRLIILLYQYGTDSLVTSIHPDLMRLVFIKSLQDWSTGEGLF